MLWSDRSHCISRSRALHKPLLRRSPAAWPYAPAPDIQCRARYPPPPCANHMCAIRPLLPEPPGSEDLAARWAGVLSIHLAPKGPMCVCVSVSEAVADIVPILRLHTCTSLSPLPYLNTRQPFGGDPMGIRRPLLGIGLHTRKGWGSGRLAKPLRRGSGALPPRLRPGFWRGGVPKSGHTQSDRDTTRHSPDPLGSPRCRSIGWRSG